MLFKRSPKDHYLSDIHDKYGFFVTWPLNTKLHLGDVGTIQNNEFKRCTSLSNLGIDYKIIEGFSTDLLFTSREGVSTYSKFGGKGIPPHMPLVMLNADISICFQKANTTYFKASNVKLCNIDDINSLECKIIERWKNNSVYEREKQWNYDWVVITELQYAEKATILLSSGKNSYMALTAEAGTPPINILNLNCSFTGKYFKNMEAQIVAENGATPLFNTLKLEIHKFPRKGIQFYRLYKIDDPNQFDECMWVTTHALKKVEFQPYIDLEDQ